MNMSYRKIVLIILAVALCSFVGGVWYGRRNDPPKANLSAGPRTLRYICPMHPQYVSDRPGTAPCCGMRLEPVYDNDGPGSPGSANPSGSFPPGTVQISPEKMQTAGIRTAAVEKGPFPHTLRTTGRVVPDERLVYRLNAGVDGWVRETYSDTTGSIVNKDQPLAAIHSPMYFSVQQSYLTAMGRLKLAQRTLQGSPEQIKTAETAVEPYRDNLRNLGMSDSQIDEIGRTGHYADQMYINAPATGFVLSRNVSPGQKFLNGEELYRIADLSRIWILADLFEHESRFVKPGQTARVLYQGQVLRATVSTVLPQFNPESRTLKTRLEMPNPGYLLRPDMFVDVEFRIELPEAVTVPVDAIVDSGLRKTVFVARGTGLFEPRSVETGWRFGDRVEIIRGLEPGEQYAVAGIFLLNSESRMKAAAGGAQAPGKNSGFRTQNSEFRIQNEESKMQKAEGGGKGQAGGKLARDLVCGMDVDTTVSGVLKAEYQGKTCYFCNPICKESFLSNPTKYLSK
jgi:RND family efflux transporter MFP subunit